MAPLVVFSDLDGTLLRHEDYTWAAARPALDALATRGVPLVLTSSKTRAEIEAWRARLDNRDPFIAENGAALFVPEGPLAARLDGVPPVPSRAAGLARVEFGARYDVLRRALPQIAQRLGVGLRGFGDMSRSEVGRLTALSGPDLARSLEREYDEPFLPDRELSTEEWERLAADAGGLGLRVTRGGRFHHLHGESSKGRAARHLIAAIEAEGGAAISLGLGDGPNDAELLLATTEAAIVAKPDGTHDARLAAAVPAARRTRGIGPVGFTEAVLAFLEAHAA
ncbi:MAG: HAD-IIB family hydrolase [Hyphomicrobiales bacterium]